MMVSPPPKDFKNMVRITFIEKFLVEIDDVNETNKSMVPTSAFSKEKLQ